MTTPTDQTNFINQEMAALRQSIDRAFDPPGCTSGDSAANEIEPEDRLHEAVMANAIEHGCPERSVNNNCDLGDDKCTCRSGLVRAMAIINR